MTAAALPLKDHSASHLWRIIRYKPLMFGGLILTYVVQYCMAMIPVLIARQILDSLSGQAAFPLGLEAAFVLWTVSELVRMGIFTSIILLETRFYQLFWSLLRANLFEAILARPGAAALPGSSGEAISRFRDDVEVIQLFMSMLYNAVATGAFALIACLIMLDISVRMTVVVFVPMVLLTALVQRLRGRIVALREQAQAATGEITQSLGEMFGAVQAIQAAQAEERIIERFSAVSERRGALALRDSLFSELLVAFSRNTTHFGTAIILLLGAESMRAGEFTVGDFVLFMFFLGWVTDFTAFFSQLVSAYRQTSVSFARLETLLQDTPAALVRHRPVYRNQTPPPVPQPAPAHEPFQSLAVDGLTVQYPHSERGIRDVSFRIGRGEIVAITGRVGAGKTTLLHALLGLLPDVAGRIRWNDREVTDAAAFFVPPHTAYTPQVPHLFSDSLRENLLMGLDGADLDAAIHAAVMEADVAGMEGGLDAPIGVRGMRLSGGQLLRAAAARMFVRQPQLLIIDDLSSALDVDTERLLWERLLAQRQHTACLIVTHRPTILNHADRVIWLEEGRVRAMGPWRDLAPLADELVG